MRKLIATQLIGILLVSGVLLSCNGASSPEADFSANQTSGSASLSVEFTGQSTGEIDEWAWDFNNDGTIDSTQQNPSHVYETPGTYTVSLTVTGKGGSYTIIKTDYINVSTPPEADFSANQTSGSASLSVEFTGQSTGEIDEWAWDFNNDGTIDSTQQNPSYVYETPGTYTVSLTVTREGGSDTVTKTDYINVSNASTLKNSVSWNTGNVSLEADDFYIMADGEKYYADVEHVAVNSDPGSLTYCTLELQWEENGVEMRLNIYFYSNQTNWWSDEIRTYDGQTEADWIYYTGVFFETNVGTAFTGDVSMQSDEDNDYSGEIHFENLTLQAF